MRKKLVLFHPALAPYRTDIFNSINDNFQLSLFLESNNLREQNLNQKLLHDKLKFDPEFLKYGFLVRGRYWSIEFIRILFGLKPEIVISSEYGLATYSTLLWRLLTFSSAHHFIMYDDNYHILMNKPRVKSLLMKLVSRLITGVIVPSEEVAELYKQRINKRNKTLCLPIIHDEELYSIELKKSTPKAQGAILRYNLEGKSVFLYVGRLVKEKNTATLLQAFRAANIPDSKLIIVGDGPEKKKLEDIVNELGLANNVLFTGKVEGLELLSWYFLAGLFVLPSVHEPFGAVVNEALLAGCSVLCSEKAGARTLINRSNGAVFDPESIDELTILLKKFTPKRLNMSEVKMRKSKMSIRFKEMATELFKGLESAKLNE